MEEGEVFRDPPRVRSNQPGIVVPARPVSRGSTTSVSPIITTSTSRLPLEVPASTSDVAGVSSNTKVWEGTGSAAPTSPRRRRFLFIPLPTLPELPIPPLARKWWRKNRRYVQTALVLSLIGIGVMIGLLVGRKNGLWSHPPANGGGMRGDSNGDGRRTTSWNQVGRAVVPSCCTASHFPVYGHFADDGQTGASLNLTYTASRVSPYVTGKVDC